MIIDLKRFLAQERPFWEELAELLGRVEADPYLKMDIKAIKRFHYLYQRASADLARIGTFSSDPQVRRYLENLVQRSYAEIHETRENPHRWRPLTWFRNIFPRTFRKHAGAFALAVAVTLLGALFGGGVVALDPESKGDILPFGHLKGSPSERVAEEEKGADEDRLAGAKTTFSSYLMTHNTKVSILAMALGMTFGLGTLILLFYNGVILGAVVVDYILAGESVFLAGWLLPHGSVEIPAILIGGQAGLVLAGALIGRNRPLRLSQRLKAVSGDLVTLIGGVAVLLVWAGMVEAFLSQYHEPVLPYALKIGFGLMELGLLTWFLWKSGAEKNPRKKQAQG